ncbi:MAG: hypothetical protein QOE61_2645, partial [Micromonosporaceae bacterium]|nr:hypothetical protein [Micromonosporaceae bacterium]
TSPSSAPSAGGPGSKPKPGTPGKGPHGQGKPAGGHQKPNGRHGKPAGRHGKPAGHHGKPAGRHGKPAGRHGKPADHGKPSGRHAKPGHNGSGTGKHAGGVGAGKHRHVRSTATPLTPSSASTGLSVSPGSFSLDPFYSAQLARASSMIGGSDQPPAFLIPIYKAAGRRYGVPWRILAAINAIETDFGRNLNVSSAGAIGWMQFMPSTWRQYGVAVDGRGRPNPYDPRDAIFAAAHYLAVAGAGHDLRGAVFAYNHALWYVDAVVWRASTISDSGGARGAAASGYALPIDGRYMHQIGRTDDGVDLEAAPDGAAVYSITPGVVTTVASDPSGFGPNYPVVLVTAGPLAGEYIYYGHVAASLVHAGEHVRAGQPIAVMGHTGDAASLGHGHIEIGFSGASGNPIDHHSGVAWTPAGAAMRHVITSLSSGFGIKNS